MHKRIVVLALLCAPLVVSGCAGSPTETIGIGLDAEISKAVISVGDSATLTFRLRNLTSDPITLDFGDSCQLIPYIESASGNVVVPPGGSYSCFTVITALTLPPLGVMAATLRVRGSSAAGSSGAALAPGKYRGYAVLPENPGRRKLRSAPVAFEVR